MPLFEDPFVAAYPPGKAPGKTTLVSIIAGLLNSKLLDGRFHGPKHVRRRHQSNHLQGADRLVHVLTRHAQLACIDRSQVGTSGGLGIPYIALERLVGDFKRLAQLIQNPGQRAQVRHTGNRTGPAYRGDT